MSYVYQRWRKCQVSRNDHIQYLVNFGRRRKECFFGRKFMYEGKKLPMRRAGTVGCKI
ncbi:hypothetical protein Plhal304r1_c066g0154401 [Plasmopara halstedii]